MPVVGVITAPTCSAVRFVYQFIRQRGSGYVSLPPRLNESIQLTWNDSWVGRTNKYHLDCDDGIEYPHGKQKKCE